jgi:hypothetical protein
VKGTRVLVALSISSKSLRALGFWGRPAISASQSQGTKRARLIPAGTRVVAAPLAAMFDPEVFPRPSHFCASREFGCYLHFGQGPRHCFGRYIAETALMEVIRSLLLVPDLARAGSNGRLTYEGPAAFSMVLTFREDRANRVTATAE